MGTWTSTPRTWVAGEIPTAAMFNSNLRDFGRAFSDAYVSYTPTLTCSTTNPTGTWTQTGYYMQAGKLVIARFFLQAPASGGATPYGSGTYRFALPVTASTSIDYGEIGTASIYDASANAVGKFPLQIDATTGTRCRIEYPATYPTGTVTLVAHDKPWTWASGDQIRGLLVYEAA